MFERISCNHSVFWGVVTGLWQGHPLFMPQSTCPAPSPGSRWPRTHMGAGTMWHSTAAPVSPLSSQLWESLCSCSIRSSWGNGPGGPQSLGFFFFPIFFFLLAYTCFTMLCWFLLYNEVNLLYVYINPLHLEPLTLLVTWLWKQCIRLVQPLSAQAAC